MTAAGAVLSAGLCAFVLYQFRHVQNPYYRDQYLWVDKHLSADRPVIGAGQTGTLGYFVRSVVNLDGKVNHEAMRALRSGTIDQYILDRGIEILIDWPEYLEKNFLTYPRLGKRFVEIDRSGDFGVFRRKAARASPRRPGD